jgi:two-component system response regulator
MNNDIEIVLVEDNIDDAELTIHALKKSKVANKIIHLKDGAEAIDYLFNGIVGITYPKVILLDLKMPKIDGIEVLRRIKSDDKTKTIPVIILTSSSGDPDVKICYELGANSYIVKPVGFENFSTSVSQLGVYWVLLNHL